MALLVEEWCMAWKDVKRDLGLGAFSWIRAVYGTILFLWTAGLAVLLLNLCYISRFAARSVSACAPDGTFRLYPESFDYWGRSTFFQITLAWGEFSFGQAKFIDTIWDIVGTLYHIPLGHLS
jgi:hypothetical protein